MKELNTDIKLFKVKELAEILKLAEVTARRYVREGKIKGFRQGKDLFVTEDNIKAYLQSLQNQED